MYISREVVISNLQESGVVNSDGVYALVGDVFRKIISDARVVVDFKPSQMIVSVNAHCGVDQSKFWLCGALLRVPYVRLPEECQNYGLATTLFNTLVTEGRKYGVTGVLVESVGNLHLERLLSHIGFAYTDYNFEDKEGFNVKKLKLFDMYKSLV